MCGLYQLHICRQVLFPYMERSPQFWVQSAEGVEGLGDALGTTCFAHEFKHGLYSQTLYALRAGTLGRLGGSAKVKGTLEMFPEQISKLRPADIHFFIFRIK